MSYVENKQYTRRRDVLRLVGKKLLILRKSLFEIVQGPERLSEEELLNARVTDAMVLIGCGGTSVLAGLHSRSIQSLTSKREQ